MTTQKFKAWLSGKSAVSVCSWVLFNTQELIQAVTEEYPQIADDFKSRLTSVALIEPSSYPQEELEELLNNTFSILPAALSTKFEMRFRSYNTRRLKQRGLQDTEQPAYKNTWVSSTQASMVLHYFYERMEAIKLRRGLFKSDDDKYAFQSKLIALYIDKPSDKQELQEKLNALLQLHCELKGWRELKSTLRSYKHITDNKLKSIKVDASAKLKLETYKQKHGLNSISEVIHALLGGIK